MPEGPEVKLSADTIRPLLTGKRLLNVLVGKTSRYRNVLPKGFWSFCRDLEHQPVHILDVKTKGKFMWWEFSNKYYLLCTFGMSGQFSPVEDKHTCFGCYLGEDTSTYQTLYFNDPRHFGTIRFTNDERTLNEKLDSLGWDPFQQPFQDHQEKIIDTVQSSPKPIAQLLMDQSIFAGVGNYIKCEALYASYISPWRSGKSLSQEEITKLCRAIDNIMRTSYDQQGATLLTYRTASGEKGNYVDFFKAYGRKVDPIGNQIIKETTPDQRSTYWCPALQK
jgi:formamidopyrimidine-DNA glycosylase